MCSPEGRGMKSCHQRPKLRHGRLHLTYLNSAHRCPSCQTQIKTPWPWIWRGVIPKNYDKLLLKLVIGTSLLVKTVAVVTPGFKFVQVARRRVRFLEQLFETKEAMANKTCPIRVPKAKMSNSVNMCSLMISDDSILMMIYSDVLWCFLLHISSHQLHCLDGVLNVICEENIPLPISTTIWVALRPLQFGFLGVIL